MTGSWLLWVTRTLFLLALLLAASVAGAAWLTLPGRDEALRIPQLGAAVTVGYDPDGVPRIRAGSAVDAAAALGTVHARDRMFQMELTRRIASGRLSEIAGPASLRLDRMMRTLGLRRRAEADFAALPGAVREMLEAYARGVNATVAARGRFVSPEFVLLGRPEPWSAVDCLMWGKVMAIWLSSNSRTELARAGLASWIAPDRLREMWPPQDGTPAPQAALVSPSMPSVVRTMAGRLAALLPAFPDPFTMPPTASNEWAVDGRLTESGAPLLAGDPHLAYGLPGIWYLARIETPDGVLAGATSPGVPFMVLGHNGRIAWTFTTAGADTEDVFIETVLPDGRYATPDGPQGFTLRQERVLVRGAPDVVFTVRETRHGPVISDLDQSTERDAAHSVLAVSMAALAPGDTAAAGLLALNAAPDLAAAGVAAAGITAPVQNLLVADRSGIAQFTTGRIPIRRSGDGRAPVDGADGAHDWTGFASGDALPHVVAPASGRLVNGNERVAPPDFPVFLGADWFGDWRARRIRRLLGGSARHSAESFAAMQVDTVSEFALAVLPQLTAVFTDDAAPSRALVLLRHWDGKMDVDLPQPLIFNAWVQAFEAKVLARAGVTALGPRAEFVSYVLSPAGRHWCGGDCSALLLDALRESVSGLAARFGPQLSDWHWGNAHQAVFGHPVLGRFGAARTAQPGDDTTIYRGGTARNGFDSVHGAAFRGVYDLSDLDLSRFIATPGQSGNPFSPLSRNLLSRWRDGGTILLGPQRGPAATLLRLSP